MSKTSNANKNDPSSPNSEFEISEIDGASLIGSTLIVNVSESLNSPSDTDTVNSILPLKLRLGVIVKISSSRTPVPLSRLKEYSKSSPSGSSLERTISISLSSSTIWVPINDKTGGSFTGITVRVNSVLSVKYPSDT